jgi:uncharacterized protein (TIGR03437 family)
MVPNQPTLDAGPLLFRGVNYAQNHQIGRVIADRGSYYFLSLQYSGSHVAWDKLANLTIDLQGSDLYFSHALVNGITISNSTNLVLQNFTADYDPLPFTQVRVVSVNAALKSIQFAVDGNWQNPIALNVAFSALPAGQGYGVEVHMFRNGRPIPGVTRMYANNPIGSSEFTGTPDPGPTGATVFSQIRPGDIAFMGIRGNSLPVNTLFCTGCTFRNIAVYSSTAGGFEAAFTQSSVFERIYSIPRPATDRLASNYVGLLLTYMGPSNQVRLNRLTRNMDDSLEYNSLFLGSIKTQMDARTFVLEASATSLLQAGLTAPNGSPVAFQSASNGTILASAAIVSQTVPTTTPPAQTTIVFDRDLPAGIVGSFMYGTDLSQRAGNSVIERNEAEEGTDCCIGFALGGVFNSVFRGNYIRRSAMDAIHLGNSPQQGNIALPPSGFINITNNVTDGGNFLRTAYSLLQLGSVGVDSTGGLGQLFTASPYQNISITGNFIADSGTAAVWMGNTNTASVSGNYFLNPNNNPTLESSLSFFGPTNQPLVQQAALNVTTSNNVIDNTSGRMWVTDVQYRELAAYAPGALIRLNAYEIGTLANPSVVLTDADGNVTPVVVQASTTHAVDVQIPASAALGGAYLSFAAGGLKFFGTLFLDSQDNMPTLNGCTYELSPASASTGADSNNLPILVVTQAGCSYTLSARDTFVSGTAGATGTGILSLGFTTNAGSSRTTTIEIAGQTVTLSQAPPATVRPVIRAVADPYNYQSGLAPGEWVTISGTGLASGPPRIWNLNGVEKLPASLGEVTVSFNGASAAVFYVSPTQINALVPAGVAPGPVQVIVQSNGVNSRPFMIVANATQPAIYALPTPDGATFFVTAALAGTANLVGNRTVDPRVLRAAQPGDVLDLYMIGLGATVDSSKFVTNQLFTGAFPAAAQVTATIGSEPAPVSFAGLISPGLYLVRLQVPQDLSPGVQAIQVTAGVVQTSPSLRLLLDPAP